MSININIFMNNDLTKIIDAVKSTEGCQRNWNYDYVIPKEHIDTIVNTAITMPTKQNREFYSLVVSTNKLFNYNVYLQTFVDDVGMKNYGRNAQTNAPLLLMWVKNPNYVADGIENDYEGEAALSIGVSAGATAFVANLLGYKTGFCQCFNEKKVLKMIQKNLNLRTNDLQVALGIGMPDIKMPDRNYVKLPNEDDLYVVHKKTKNIKIYKI